MTLFHSVPSGTVAVLAALGASLGYAGGSVLQQRAARQHPAAAAAPLGLLARLARQPLWVAGFSLDGFAYGLQFLALGAGALIVVQPLLVASVLFALPLGAALERRRIGRRDWAAAGVTVAGLSVFLWAAHPARGLPDARAVDWLALGSATAGALAILTLLARRAGGFRRALCLGAAAGIVNGIVAALTKSCAHLLHHGVAHVAGAWQPYALAASAVASTVLTQSAFQAGPLVASLPILTVVDPLASLVIGAVMFGEGVRLGGLYGLLDLLAAVAVAGALFALARSPLLDEVAPPEVSGRETLGRQALGVAGEAAMWPPAGTQRARTACRPSGPIGLDT